VLSLCGLVFGTPGASQAGINVWTSHGPYGAGVNALVIDPTTPSTLYAVCDYGAWQSTDSGGGWSAITTFGVRALAINPTTPSTLYAGTPSGVFQSTNSGGSWSAVNTGLTYLYVYALAIDPTTPSTLYAVSVNKVWQSTNSGASWSAVNTGLSSYNVWKLAIDPTTPSTLYAGTSGGGVFRSTNSGGSWSAVNTGLTNLAVYALAIDPTTPSTLYAGTVGGFVFQSTDSGGSWSRVSTGLSGPGLTDVYEVYALAIDPTTPSTLYAGTGRDVFRSTNSGASWSRVNTGLGTAPLGVEALAIDPTTPSTLYAGTQGQGVFQSTNSGASWSAVNTGLSGNVGVHALAIDPTTPSTLYAGTGTGYAGTGIGVFRSTNSGGSWSAVNTGLPSNVVIWALAIDPATPSTLYAGTEHEGVFQSTNSGGSWSAVSTGITGTVLALGIDPTTPSTLYAGTLGGGVFQSTNSGGSWRGVNTGLSGFVVGRALAIDPITPSTLYAGTNGGVFDIELLDIELLCGNGALDSGEQCDDGAATGSLASCCNAGCQFQANGTPCTDRNPCTASDTCSAGTCVSGPATDCDDNNPCTVDTCDPAVGCQHSITCASNLLPGGGRTKTDCMQEWLSQVPPSSARRNRLVCTDDDPACDFGTTTGACTFHIAMCFNVNASPGVCTGTDVEHVTVMRPGPKPPNAADALNRTAMEDRLVELGGTVQGICKSPRAKRGQFCQQNSECDSAPGKGNGVCRRVVEFGHLTAANSCTPFANITVPSRHKRRLWLRTTPYPSGTASDMDVLTLVCRPKR
jgi:photosystem II stability/assembly factor-like uncharacterized protein